MATKPKAQATGTQVANYDEELARLAQQYASAEASAGGLQWFTVKGGVLTFAGSPIPGNAVAVIIADMVMENSFYEGIYDADNPQPPTCFSFSREEKTMEPHPQVVEAGNAQHGSCRGCEFNEFGSADTGKGKACKNTRRLALLPCGTLDDRGKLILPDDPREYLERADFGFYRPPVTSVRGLSNYVTKINNVFHLPPFGVYTKMSVLPDAHNQFSVVFEPLDKVPRDLLPVVMARNVEAAKVIELPYPLPSTEEPEPKKPEPKKPARGAKAPAPTPKKPARR
jgi:hypothetical protein